MASKGLILFCFLLALHKNFLELQCPGSEPVEQEPTEGLRLGSVIRSLRRPGFMGLNLITRPKRQPTKGNNALYLALLLLCAGDIETNPGPTNIITCLIILLFLYITLDGCGWSSSFSLAVPVMVFSRESNINGGGSGDSGGGNDNSKGDDRVAIISSTVVVAAAIITATGTIIAAIIGAITKCKCCSCKTGTSTDQQEVIKQRACDTEAADVLNNSPRPTVTLGLESIREALQSKHVSNTCTAAADRQSEVTDNKLEEFTGYLKSLYKAKTQANVLDDDHWPPPVTDKVFNLAMIMPEQVQRRNIDDHFTLETITGKIDDILQRKVPMTLEQIFEGTEQKKILIEGAPGCGKSTLSLYICHEWVAGRLLQERSQVILVKLREKVVQNAKSIADLLPKRSSTMGQNIEKDITACDGEGVLFIFDGWDELPEKAPGHSTIRDILDCKQLHKSSVMITSRPISSMNLHKLVNTRIEILGFTKDELWKYFTGCLGDDQGKVKELQQRIKENPVVEGSCYLPLNASILVHLFKCDGVLPHTQFGIFSALICNCMYRHLKKKKEQLDTPEIMSLDKLPTAIQSQFECICEMAYKGVIEDHIIFDLKRSFNTLGLLQGVESFASGGMPSHSYNFLHLSIQELLAAIHMATKIGPRKQVAQFKKLFGRARFSAVFQFYAAKTKLKTRGMDKIVIQVVRKCMKEKKATVLTPHSGTNSDLDSGGSSLGHKSQPLLLSLLHCLFEAQDETLCQLVVKELKGELQGLEGISLSPADCLSVGYFLTHCRQFKVHLGICSMGDDGCKALFRKDNKYDLEYLNLFNNFIGDEGAKALSDAIKTMANLKKLDLHWNSIGDEGAKALSDAIKTMANLKELSLYGNTAITDEGETVHTITDEGRRVLEEAAKEKGIQLIVN